jgi:ATP-binding cassette subfamily A (ABC1) protein 3
MLIFDFFLYGGLALYFEKVLPTEFGVSQSACFCFKKNYWQQRNATNQRRSGAHQMLLDEEAGADTDVVDEEYRNDFEPVSSQLHAQEQDAKCLKIRKLRKVYDNGKIAVDSLSLTMYSG